MVFFFVNDSAPTGIYTLSLHDALPISPGRAPGCSERYDATCSLEIRPIGDSPVSVARARRRRSRSARSEEHTSELQSQSNLVCRLLLEKKKQQKSFSQTYLSILLLCVT